MHHMTQYDQIFKRNIGVVTSSDQETLRKTHVAVAGCGAIGSNALNILARAGVGAFSLADPDTFSVSNINRQFGATLETAGRNKADVLAEAALSINPSVKIKKFEEGLNSDNMDDFLEGADAVLDGIDFLEPAIRKELISKAQQKGLHVFLAPALGFGISLVVFSPEGPGFDEFFGKLSASPSPDELFNIGKKIFPIFPSYIDREAYAKGMDGAHHIPTFAPPISLASTVEAADVIFHVLNKREPVCLPEIKWIDLFEQRIEILDTRQVG
jgi:molybdopterin/thiamine biosynthesis adenylyltransferase